MATGHSWGLCSQGPLASELPDPSSHCFLRRIPHSHGDPDVRRGRGPPRSHQKEDAALTRTCCCPHTHTCTRARGKARGHAHTQTTHACSNRHLRGRRASSSRGRRRRPGLATGENEGRSALPAPPAPPAPGLSRLLPPAAPPPRTPPPARPPWQCARLCSQPSHALSRNPCLCSVPSTVGMDFIIDSEPRRLGGAGPQGGGPGSTSPLALRLPEPHRSPLSPCRAHQASGLLGLATWSWDSHPPPQVPS